MQEIEIANLRRLTEVVKSTYNYDFTNYAMSSFKRRIGRVLDLFNFASVDALISKIQTDRAFFETFVQEITVNVTEMFRDPSFWRILREDIVPNLLLNHSSINIWHAGCSSGEEVYSMCILLNEMGILDKSKIIATDLDKGILERARAGRFKLKNMELNEKNYIRFQGTHSIKDYYTIRGDDVQMNPDLVRNVSWREHDLVNGPVFNKFDLVLCRNVMIYFNQNLQNEVLKKIHESMFKYGYLAIGNKESLIWCEIANKFIVVNNEEKIYKKIKE
ncbi:CheR family methyltransferase [Marinigracilibium pacificum]|uniref:Protein-glutamate O-methyltransferase CheR n=1 Tax=Marinigracilibium pacificum TaxID=2729599 RepID=A0A848J2Q7_9BACT|nr:protein-glutamate O-methyltransferase CheR [Marinigracilibium pacificum]NMM48609.1 protein-glutamate O-methyltransferase CheR [Marinigracilibium pacificum]